MTTLYLSPTHSISDFLLSIALSHRCPRLHLHTTHNPSEHSHPIHTLYVYPGAICWLNRWKTNLLSLHPMSHGISGNWISSISIFHTYIWGVLFARIPPYFFYLRNRTYGCCPVCKLGSIDGHYLPMFLLARATGSPRIVTNLSYPSLRSCRTELSQIAEFP